MNTATESVCPKGWTLPTTKQIDSNRDVTSFNPVRGGAYNDSMLNNETTHGRWWGSEASNSTERYYLRYYNGNLYTGDNGGRHNGFYIRCVSEEKTVTDLTYLQDMTGEIANKAAGFFICLK